MAAGEWTAPADEMDSMARRGRSITVIYDPQARPFLSAMRLSNQGGPQPAFKEQLVAPLW